MSDSIGILNQMGISAVAGWDTAFSASTAIIPFEEEGLNEAFERVQQVDLIGSGGKLPSYQGIKVIQGPTKHTLCYDVQTLIAAVPGNDSAGTISIVDRLGSGSVNAFWIEIDKGHIRHRFGAAKPMKMTISGEKNNSIKLDLDWYFKDRVATASAMASLTPPTNRKILFSDLVFRIGDQVDALTSGDDLGIESFEIVLDRAPKADDYVSDASAPELPLEVIENDFRVASLSFKVPRYNSDTIVGWKDADTALQATLTFTSSAGTLTIKLPELRITEGFDANVGGPGALTLEGTLEAYRSLDTSHPMHPATTMNELEIAYT